MNPQAKEIQNLFSRISSKYDFMNRTLSGSIDLLWRKKAVSYLPSFSSPLILDLCAGTLDFTLSILKKHRSAKIVALDFVHAMLERGKKKISQPFSTQVSLVVGDGSALPFPSEHFHAVVCGFGIRNIQDNPQALQEIFRILKPRGKIIILEFFRPTRLLSQLFYATYGKWVIPKLGNWLAKDPKAYQYLFDSIQSYYSIDEFLEMLGRTGFEKLEEEPLTGGVASIAVGEKP